MRVLIGLDDQCTAEEVLRFIGGHTWSEDTQFKLVYVLAPIMVHQPMASEPRMFELMEEQAELKAKELLHQTAQNLKADSGFEVEKELCIGMPATTLIERAKKWPADLIIMGTHGRRGLDRFVYGSVAADVAAAAPCSVAVLMLPSAHKTSPVICSQC